MMEEDFQASERVDWGEFKRRPLRQKISEAICRPLAPLL